jgi:hypothetical protein
MSPLRHRFLTINIGAVLTSIFVLLLATVATAENWIAGSGNWNTPGNWNPATVPSGSATL